MATTPNYNESTSTSTQWRRTKEILIRNPYDAPARIFFEEEDLVQLGDRIISSPIPATTDRLSIYFNPTATFKLIDPSTGQLTENTMTHMEVYNILYSIYMNAAVVRDSQGTI